METSMLDCLRLPKADRIVFERSPLVLAICQIRFQPILSIGDPAYVAALQRALIDRYPILDSYGTGEIQLEGLSSAARVEPGTPAHRWKFTDSNDTWTVVLALDFISIETRHYEDFEDFISRLRELLVAFSRSFPGAIGTRIGLRYINEIRLDDREARAVVRPELLGPLMESVFDEYADQAIQQVVLTFGEGEGINFRHGVLRGTTIQPRPGEIPPNSQFYLLDYDAYREYPRSRAIAVDPDVICGQVEVYHEVISRLFRWSITDEYTSSLGVRRHA